MLIDAKQSSEPAKPQACEDNFTLEQLIEKKRYYALKSLLLAEEYQRLKILEDSINHPKTHAGKIAPSLPEAIKQSDLSSVYQALEINNLVHDKIIESVQNNTALYTDALFPVIFPAIKKSIAEAFKEMMQSLNYAIEEGLSLNRIGWHVEALRAGVPYREIVLQHTLTYRVEQVFLIHRETGLLMRHVSNEGVTQLRDNDAVSAMLTAIQDFIKDSFSVNENDCLDTVVIGDYTVFLTRDVNAVLACVTQGITPYSLREKFNDTLSLVNKNYSYSLKNFDGDSSTLESADEVLQSCLVSETKDAFKKKDHSIKNFAILLVLVLAVLAYWRYDYWKFQQRAEAYTTAIQKIVGVVITSHYYSGKQLVIKGLYDPLAANPQQSSQKFGLKKQEVNSHWQAYQSLEPYFVEQRVASVLQPPNFVNLELKNNILVISGAADQAWIDKIALFQPALAGIKTIDTRQLKTYQQTVTDTLQAPATVMVTFENFHLLLQGTTSLDWVQTLQAKLTSLSFLQSYDINQIVIAEEVKFQTLVTQLEAFYIYFANGKAQPKETEQEYVDSMAEMIKQLQKLAVQLNKPIDLVITGHTDKKGTVRFNQTLAEKRSAYIVEQLKNQGISIGLKKAIQTAGNKQANSKLERKISLKVIYNGADEQ